MPTFVRDLSAKIPSFESVKMQITLLDLPQELLELIASFISPGLNATRYTKHAVYGRPTQTQELKANNPSFVALTYTCRYLYDTLGPWFYYHLDYDIDTRPRSFFNFVGWVKAQPSQVARTRTLTLYGCHRAVRVAMPLTPRRTRSSTKRRKTDHDQDSPYDIFGAGPKETPCLGPWFLHSFTCLVKLQLSTTAADFTAGALPLDPDLLPCLSERKWIRLVPSFGVY